MFGTNFGKPSPASYGKFSLCFRDVIIGLWATLSSIWKKREGSHGLAWLVGDGSLTKGKLSGFQLICSFGSRLHEQEPKISIGMIWCTSLNSLCLRHITASAQLGSVSCLPGWEVNGYTKFGLVYYRIWSCVLGGRYLFLLFSDGVKPKEGFWCVSCAAFYRDSCE